MKRIFAATLLLTGVAFSQAAGTAQGKQNPPASSQTPPAQGSQTPPAQTNPGAAGGQTPPAAPAAPAHVKGQPMAKSQQEFADYQAVVAQPDLNAEETAADAFAAKYPDSELRSVMYVDLMRKAEQANNAEKTLAAAKKVLALEPENTFALITAANVYAERTRETDLDRDERYTEGLADAEKAIKTIDTGLVLSPSATPEQVQGAKIVLTSMAHSAMGFIELNKKNYAAAEKHLQEAADMVPSRPDETTLYRLALAQHAQKKFPQAMANASKAVEVATANNNAAVLQMANEEKAKLAKAK